MDKEGFSGCDGRTTIFDYWSVDTISRWRNGGKFGTANLSTEEVNLRKFYTTLLNLVGEEPCITDGEFYDLMYANYENMEFDSTKQYAFIRSYKKEFVLVITNFSSNDVDVTVQFPPEAFEFLKVDTQKIKSAKELLTNKDFKLPKEWDKSLKTNMKANSGKIIKFSLN